jgi:hypothetical protein
MDARGLARRLGNYEVASAQLKVDGHNVRGYRREDLYDAWVRYLAPPSAEALPPLPPLPGRSEGVPPVADGKTVPLPQPLPATSPLPDTPPLSREVAEVAQVADDGGGGPEDDEAAIAALFAAFPGSVVVDLPEDLVDLPLDEVGACRVCAGATVTIDETGPVHGRCRGAA